MGLLMTTVISIVEARPNQPIEIRHCPRFGGRREAKQRRWLLCRAAPFAQEPCILLKTSSCRAPAGPFQFRLQAIASDIGLGHGLPSLHTLLICARRILQVAAGVSLPAEANHHDALVHRDGSRIPSVDVPESKRATFARPRAGQN